MRNIIDDDLTIPKSGLELICNANNMYQAFLRSKRCTDWKDSVQRYEMDVLTNIRKTQDAIRNHSYKMKPLVCFLLKERGRLRRILSQHISDRVVQRSLNDNILIPRFARFLIYDNGASVKGKGPDFARNRFRTHLQKAYKEYDGDCYILHIDFSKYFDNILHKIALKQLSTNLTADELEFVIDVFKTFEIDLSAMSAAEAEAAINGIFNATTYVPPVNSSKPLLMRKCVGIGNQISQLTGILYPYEIDNYIKIVKGIKYYGRYMDDSYIIAKTKEELQELYEDLRVRYASLGIFVNTTKTQIVHISNWNMFLKINFKITSSGKVIRKIHNETLRRCRCRIRKHKVLVDKHRLTDIEALNAYKSWRGVYWKYDSKPRIRKLDEEFKRLFPQFKKEKLG